MFSIFVAILFAIK